MAVPNPAETENIRSAFIKAAIWHGTLNDAEEILTANPWLAGLDIHIAAIMGDDIAVRQFIAANAANAIALSAPFDGNALVYLCLSKYLRLNKRREDAFLKAAAALMDAGADPNSGFWTKGQYPEFETALYGATGVAQNVVLTRLLLDRGADPNDIEACYHSPETYDNGAMELLVNTGKITAHNLSMMLIRKHDFHDYEGARFLLEYGADPNQEWRPGFYPIHQALARCNSLDMIRLLLDHHADMAVLKNGVTAVAHAARTGRDDVLNLFAERGIVLNLQGVDQLIAACAMGDAAKIQELKEQQPLLLDELVIMGSNLLARFSCNGNVAGVKQLLDLGVDVNAPFTDGDPYFGIPKNSLPMHVAAWLGYPSVVKLLIARGAAVDLPDANGNTPLILAVKACVDSYWTNRRSPNAVAALLQAGASADKVPFPSGYAEVDELLGKYRA